MKIRVERNPSPERLTALRVEDWPIWSKEVSTFPWSYDSTETCYILEGEVIVTPEGGESVQISKGDLVTFPVGMACTWDIRHPVKKHYQFD
ncbi:cupin domain-containing protein [Candidatus Methylomirabilis sp.]|uniref:cupin domain-containing protein n=1 Tax=Candidatus Methylomirabilis sp. TaxID=2032687 RepID=UPI0030761583